MVSNSTDPSEPIARNKIGQGLKLVVCISAANLLFMNAWFELYPGTADQYLQGFTATPPAVAAIWTNILSLATLFYIGHSQVKQSKWALPLALCGGLIVAISLLDPGRRLLTQYSPIFEPVLIVRAIGLWPIFGMATFICAGTLSLIFWKPAFVYRAMLFTLLILAPVPLFFTWTVVRSIPKEATPGPSRIAKEHQGIRTPKVVVLIFDEWDYEYGFTKRPSWIHLPEIDRFSREYGSYSQCWPAAGETLRSIPSMATGRHWLGGKFGLASELMLKDPDSRQWKTWSETDDLFQSLARSDWRTRMIQWWHVFPPTFLEKRPGLSVLHHSAYPRWDEPRSAYQTFQGSLKRSWVRMFRSFQAYYHLIAPANVVPARVAMVEVMGTELLTAVGSRQHDLVWVHMPFPHAPAIYNARSGAYLDRPDHAVSNLDNMVLADKTLGRLRKVMEAQGDWDNALVILTADHWQRENNGDNLPLDPGKYRQDEGLRVPLLVKWPNQNRPWAIHKPVCNTSVRRMVESIAEGRNPGEFFVMAPPPPGNMGGLLHNQTR